jgi:chemotaxis protein methyltransferase CheR
VWRRIGHRLAELHLGGPDAYRAYLLSHPEEWAALESYCHISISRFLRDREVFDRLGRDVLPDLAERAARRGDGRVRAWSAGCASGEEPYSLMLLWRFVLSSRFPRVALEVLATDVDDVLLARARAARYRGSSLREVPHAWRDAAFVRDGDSFALRDELRSTVEFRRSDLRLELPDATFDLILCRNVICTYFDEPLQRRTLGALLALLRPGGVFVIGRRERLPRGLSGLTDWIPELGIFRRVAALAPCPAPRGELPLWS